MRYHPNKAVRDGATMVEFAVIMIAFLLLIFGIIDLGRGVFRFNQLSQAARYGARQAIVHGFLAPSGWNGGAWGPSAVDVKADAEGNPIVEALKPALVHCELAKTRIQMVWLDSNNALESRVRVTISCPFQPVLSSFFGGAINLSATSTMTIAH